MSIKHTYFFMDKYYNIANNMQKKLGDRNEKKNLNNLIRITFNHNYVG